MYTYIYIHIDFTGTVKNSYDITFCNSRLFAKLMEIFDCMAPLTTS